MSVTPILDFGRVVLGARKTAEISIRVTSQPPIPISARVRFDGPQVVGTELYSFGTGTFEIIDNATGRRMRPNRISITQANNTYTVNMTAGTTGVGEVVENLTVTMVVP